MLQSAVYANVPQVATMIRNVYGFANVTTMINVRNNQWILEHLETLSPPDIALIAEQNRDARVRELVVQRMYSTLKVVQNNNVNTI